MVQQRKSLRLSNYDYGNAGIYFITFCTKDKKCILGEVIEGQVHLSPVGVITKCVIDDAVQTNMSVLQFVIMPNHVHLLVQIHQKQSKWGLGRFVSYIKGNVSRACCGLCWQRGYYDHIVRNEKDLARCREYIANNPLQWTLDSEYRDA